MPTPKSIDDIPITGAGTEGISALQYMEARLKDSREHASIEMQALREMLFRFREDTAHMRAELLEYMNHQFQERDIRGQQRFEASQQALGAAMLAAEKAINAALASAAQAVSKAEAATTARFEGVNEFRAQLADQTATFMPRAEATSRFDNLSEKLDGLASRLDKSEGSGYGKNAVWGYLIGAVGLITGIAALLRYGHV